VLTGSASRDCSQPSSDASFKSLHTVHFRDASMSFKNDFFCLCPGVHVSIGMWTWAVLARGSESSAWECCKPSYRRHIPYGSFQVLYQQKKYFQGGWIFWHMLFCGAAKCRPFKSLDHLGLGSTKWNNLYASYPTILHLWALCQLILQER
jgi:hypothetical protein